MSSRTYDRSSDSITAVAAAMVLTAVALLMTLLALLLGFDAFGRPADLSRSTSLLVMSGAPVIAVSICICRLSGGFGATVRMDNRTGRTLAYITIAVAIISLMALDTAGSNPATF